MNCKIINNLTKHFLNLFWIKNHKKPIMGPVRATFILSYRCNSRCSMCSRWKEKSEDFSTEEAKRVLEQLANMGVVNVSLSGGEPLLREDFFELVSYAKKLGIYYITTTSNGILIDKHLNEILDSGLSVFAISIDSLKPETYKNIRGIDALPKVIANIKLLLETRKNKKQKKPYIELCTVINKQNFFELPGIANMCKSIGADAFNFNPINQLKKNRFHIPEDLKFNPADEKELARVIDLLVNDKALHLRANKEHYKYMPLFIFDQEKTRDIECWAGRMTVYIDPMGIYPCDARITRLGNARRSSLKEIWFLPGFQKIRDDICNKEHPLCWMSCYAPFRFTPFNLLRFGLRDIKALLK